MRCRVSNRMRGKDSWKRERGGNWGYVRWKGRHGVLGLRHYICPGSVQSPVRFSVGKRSTELVIGDPGRVRIPDFPVTFRSSPQSAHTLMPLLASANAMVTHTSQTQDQVLCYRHNRSHRSRPSHPSRLLLPPQPTSAARHQELTLFRARKLQERFRQPGNLNEQGTHL
jgi:hypothetical protein